MPLEDRKDLLLGLVESLVASSNLSQMAVAVWCVETVMAAIFLLTNCGPATPIRWLKGDKENKYDLGTAVEILKKAAQSFFGGDGKRLWKTW